MKRHLSCLGLAAAHSVRQAALILAALAAAETGLFALAVRRADFLIPAEYIFDGALFRAASALALVLLAAAVSRSAGGAACCTLDRLPVGRRTLLAWWTVYALLCLMCFWAVQLGVTFGLCRWYAALAPEMKAGQTAFLTYYASGLLHGFLPLSDGGGWWCTGLLYLGLTLSCGGAAALRWRGRWNAAPMVLAAATWLPNSGVQGGGWRVVLGAAALLTGALVWWSAWGEDAA